MILNSDSNRFTFPYSSCGSWAFSFLANSILIEKYKPHLSAISTGAYHLLWDPHIQIQNLVWGCPEWGGMHVRFTLGPEHCDYLILYLSMWVVSRPRNGGWPVLTVPISKEKKANFQQNQIIHLLQFKGKPQNLTRSLFSKTPENGIIFVIFLKKCSWSYFNVIPIHCKKCGKYKTFFKNHSLSETPYDNYYYYMWLVRFLISMFNDIMRIITYLLFLWLAFY